MPLLELPDVRQRDLHDCGVAAALCVLRFLGVRKSRDELEAALGTTRLDGTDPRAMEATFRREGLAVQSGTMDLADLAHHAAHGRPVVCLVNHGAVGALVLAAGARPSAEGHYVVSAGLRRNFVHLQDPEDGPGRVRSADFLANWSDWDRQGGEWRRFGVAVSRFG